MDNTMSNNLFPRVGGIGTNMPSSTFGGKVYPDQPFIKSNRGVALLEQCQFVPGYGDIPLGSVVTFVAAGPHKGQTVPYATGIPMLGLVASGATTFTVSEAQASAFAVGDTLTFHRAATSSSASLGAVTAISAAVNDIVTVTFATAAPAGTPGFTDTVSHTGAGFAICDQSVFSSVTGALGSILFSNAVVYKNRVYGMDATVKAALNVLDYGDFYVIR